MNIDAQMRDAAPDGFGEVSDGTEGAVVGVQDGKGEGGLCGARRSRCAVGELFQTLLHLNPLPSWKMKGG